MIGLPMNRRNLEGTGSDSHAIVPVVPWRDWQWSEKPESRPRLNFLIPVMTEYSFRPNDFEGYRFLRFSVLSSGMFTRISEEDKVNLKLSLYLTN
jgi:hypothetical protein